MDEKLNESKRKFLIWTPPVITFLSLPKSGFAANISGPENKAPKAKDGEGNYHKNPGQRHDHEHKHKRHWWSWHSWF